jgi:two-component system, OmpR family, phosphate regulon sensor histidine kinase PhoR
MKLSIRLKLMVSYLVLIMIIGITLFAFLSHTLDEYMVKETRDGLFSEARLTRLIVERDPGALHRDAPGLAATIARETRSRVTLISMQGVVVGDSEVKPEDLKELENHLHRPEVQEALKTGQGSSLRYSATLRITMLYVALPLKPATGEGGFLRLALPLSALKQTKSGINTILVISLLIASVVALLLSSLLSSITTRSFRDMAVAAARIGTGDFSRRIPVTSKDEAGELARIMNDMTARIEVQLKSLAAEKNRLDTILRGMGEGLMVTDAEGVITLVNPPFRALFGVGDEVEGKPLIEITRHPALHEAFSLVVKNRCERLEEISLALDREKVLMTHWVPLMDKGAFLGVVAVFHDISELKRLEKVRKDFVANVSHELRTPVTVIKGYAETLLNDTKLENPEQAARFIQVIHSHSERLADLIRDLLVLSELESGTMTLELSPLSIGGVARHAAALLDQAVKEKGIVIDCSGIGDSVKVMADRGRMEQVFVNLLDNAVKYTPGSGTVTVTATESGGMVIIAVQDSGLGIPPKDLPRLFERFYRVDSGRSRAEGGTGLGLSIVKHIVQLHGGTITVTSTPGKGSTFTFTLRKG